MFRWIRPHAFQISVAIAVLVNLASCYATSEAIQGVGTELETFDARLAAARRRATTTEMVGHGLMLLALGALYAAHRTEPRLRLNQHEALLAEIPEPLHILDAVGRVVYWNRGAAQLYGYEPVEVVGQNASDLLKIVPPAVPDENVHARDDRNAQQWSGKLKATSKAGKSLWIERRRTRMFQGDDAIGDVIFDLDLGERSRLQQVDRRRQRLESLGTLASGIAHDLNNLLTPILMSARMLQRDTPNVDRDALIETMGSAASRGAELVSQLLTFARGGDGQQVPIRLEEVLPETIAILARTMPKQTQLTLDIEPDLPAILGDETEISQAVMNLTINARDSMTEAGQIRVLAAQQKLFKETSYTATILPPGDYVIISVTDTGTGIPPAIRDRIFDPFFSTKERGQGTGLGLSTAIGIVKSHHGAIGVESSVGKGTTVSIVLPVRSEIKSNA